MPSLKLPKLIRRDADRPSLKQRVAGLKATAGRVMRKGEGNEPVTLEGAAALSFGAYSFPDPVATPKGWTDKFASHALSFLIADRTLRMTKPELVAFIREADAEDGEMSEAMFQALDSARESFEGWSKLLRLARTRYLVAAAAAAVESGADQAETPAHG